MTTASNQIELARIIKALDSSLKQRILASGAFTMGGKIIGGIEKINRLSEAEGKYGRRKIDPTTGQPEIDTLRASLDNLLAGYGALLDCDSQIPVMAGPEALVALREQPYTRVMSDEQLALRCQLTGLTRDAIQKQQLAASESKAAAFSKKAGAILGEFDSMLAFATLHDVEDITVEDWDMQQSVENCIKKYRAAVAAGRIYDESDMFLAMQDIAKLEGEPAPSLRKVA